MTYAVTWKLTAIQQLERLASAAVDPDAVRRAASFVDYTLRRTPRDMGESRSKNVRLWYWDVLAVYFKIEDAAKQVEVHLVGPARRRS